MLGFPHAGRGGLPALTAGHAVLRRWCLKCLVHFNLSLPVLFFPLCFLLSVIPFPLLSLNLPHQSNLYLSSLNSCLYALYSVYFVSSYFWCCLHSVPRPSLFPSLFLSTLSAPWWVLIKASSTSCSQHLQPTPVLILIIHSNMHSLLSPRKGLLLKMWAGRGFSFFLPACFCVSVSACVCIHLLEPGMLAH